MNREQYISEIEKQNSNCTCRPELEYLYKAGKKAMKKRKKDEEFSREADFKTIRESDLNFFVDYKKAKLETLSSISDYLKILTNLAETRLIIFNVYDAGTGRLTEKVSYGELINREILESSAIVTANCSLCNNQIDIITSSW